MSIAGHWLGKHVPLATNTHTTIEELLETVFSVQAVLKLYREAQQLPELRDRKIWS
jgi:hypothetical protein